MNVNEKKLVELMLYKYMWTKLKGHFEENKAEDKGVGEIYLEFFKLMDKMENEGRGWKS